MWLVDVYNCQYCFFFFFKQKTAYEISACLVGSEMCIRDRVYPFRHLNSLNTVGYKEMFKYLDGEWTLEFAIGKIKQNSRIYSRKQMTWFKRDKDIVWFHPDQQTEIMQYIHSVNH